MERYRIVDTGDAVQAIVTLLVDLARHGTRISTSTMEALTTWVRVFSRRPWSAKFSLWLFLNPAALGRISQCSDEGRCRGWGLLDRPARPGLRHR
jgi:hypothetical protein